MNELHQKVHRALELERIKNKTQKEIDEYKQIMSDPYLYDKVHGLRQGGII